MVEKDTFWNEIFGNYVEYKDYQELSIELKIIKKTSRNFMEFEELSSRSMSCSLQKSPLQVQKVTCNNGIA